MTEWWTYGLHSFLLFSPRVYWRLIEQYNQGLWPVQVPVLLVGSVVLFGLWHRQAWAWRSVWALLACAWFFVGWAFLDQRYAAINWVVRYLAPLFWVEGLLLLTLAFRPPAAPSGGRLGLLLLGYALVGHPLVTALLGGTWSAAEMAGLLPDPTAIATLGVVLAKGRSGLSWGLMVIPVLWCLFSFLTLLAMGAPAAWIVLAVPGLLLMAGRKRGGGGQSARPLP